MAILHHNITTVLTKDLLTVGDNVSNAKYISIANVHASATAKVDLFLNKKDNNYYLLKNYAIAKETTLTLTKENNIVFDNSANGFSLRIQVDNGDGSTAVPVDVIITR
tara:strand:+ start:1350 stop:1673 length:324 start_codon:yes stop_codon:yes gene_type:complete